MANDQEHLPVLWRTQVQFPAPILTASQSPAAPVPGDLLLYSGFYGLCTYMVHIPAKVCTHTLTNDYF